MAKKDKEPVHHAQMTEGNRRFSLTVSLTIKQQKAPPCFHFRTTKRYSII